MNLWFWVSSTVANWYKMWRLQKFSETKTHPCSSNGVFHQCNFTSTQSAAVQQQPEQKTKGGLKSHHIGPKITEEHGDNMLYQTTLGVSIFDNSKISSVRFAQSIVF